jgi:hypothetical protein
MLVHEMAVLHRGMMKAAARMNEKLDAAGVIDRQCKGGGQRAGLSSCRGNFAHVQYVSASLCSRYSASERVAGNTSP